MVERIFPWTHNEITRKFFWSDGEYRFKGSSHLIESKVICWHGRWKSILTHDLMCYPNDTISDLKITLWDKFLALSGNLMLDRGSSVRQGKARLGFVVQSPYRITMFTDRVFSYWIELKANNWWYYLRYVKQIILVWITLDECLSSHGLCQLRLISTITRIWKKNMN